MFDLLFVVLIALVFLLPFWMIFSKAGFPGWLALTMIVPILNAVMIFYLAFAEWPIHRNGLHKDVR